MASHVNFYENLKEAQLRLRNTVVLYDGEPFYVLAITNHKNDGIFRMYLDPIGASMAINSLTTTPVPSSQYPQDHPSLGPSMDAWMDANPNSKLQRKMMNSPKFNKFRPFSVGMVNYGVNAYFTQRSPTRQTFQGLSPQMLVSTRLDVDMETEDRGGAPRQKVELFTDNMRSAIMNDYPTPELCIEKLIDPNIGNHSVGFHKEFGFVRGPMETLFLAYRDSIVGFLPDNDLRKVRIGKEKTHTKEAVADLGLFNTVII